jgi:hypothetical protein
VQLNSDFLGLFAVDETVLALDFEVQLEFDGLIELWCCCTLLVAEEYS